MSSFIDSTAIRNSKGPFFFSSQKTQLDSEGLETRRGTENGRGTAKLIQLIQSSQTCSLEQQTIAEQTVSLCSRYLTFDPIIFP